MIRGEDGIWYNAKSIDKDTGSMNRQNMLDFVKIQNTNKKLGIKMYYDYDTINKSFFNMYVLFKKLGIQNHSEHLLIFHPELIGVDPFDEMLPDKVKKMIYEELKINPWYFFREIVKITIDENTADSFNLTIGNYTAIFLMMRNQNFYMEAPRQIGKTFVITTMLAYVMNFRTENSKIGHLHYKEKGATGNIGKVMGILDSLPKYLRFHTKTRDKRNGAIKNTLKKTSTSAKEFKHELFSNILEAIVVGQSEAAANQAGRGLTVPIIFVDEICHIKYNDVAYSAYNQAFSTASLLAKKYGKPFGQWFAGTPGGLDTRHGRWMAENINNFYLNFTPKHFMIFDMDEDDIRAHISKYTMGNFFYIHFKHDELGYNDAWFYDKTINENIASIRSEVMIEWEASSGNNPFSKSILKSAEINSSKRKVVTMPTEFGFDLTIYPKEEDMYTDLGNYFFYNYNKGVIVGVDTARGTGDGDYSVLIFIDAVTGRVIAHFSRNDISQDDLATFMIEFTERYFHKPGLKIAYAVERNDAHVILSIFSKSDFMTRYLMVYPVTKAKLARVDAKIDIEDIIDGKRMKFDYGLHVGNEIRNVVFKDLLFNILKKHVAAVSVPAIYNEINTLVEKITPGGVVRIEAAQGSHDDHVFALLHAYHALIHGNKWLELRNHIKIDFSTLEIGMNESILDMSGKANKRIVTEYKIVGGMFITKYRDTKMNRYVTQDEADEILSNENTSQIIQQREDELINKEKKEFNIAKDIIKQRMGGDDDYVMIVDEEGGEEVDTSRFGGSSPTYNSTMSNLLDSLYDL